MNHIYLLWIFYLNRNLCRDGREQLTAGPTELLREVDSAKVFGFMHEFLFFSNENNVIQISFRF